MVFFDTYALFNTEDTCLSLKMLAIHDAWDLQGINFAQMDRKTSTCYDQLYV